jgi:acyl carrier protein
MASTDVVDEIRTYIAEEILEDTETSDLPPDQPLLSGLLDSFGLMSLLGFLEERYEVTISNDQVVSENFKSVEALAEFVERKRRGES